MEQEKHTYTLIKEGGEYYVFNDSVNFPWVIGENLYLHGLFGKQESKANFHLNHISTGDVTA